MGDIIEVLRKDIAEGWWEGKLGARVGVFPDNFVELLPAQVEEEKVHAKLIGLLIDYVICSTVQQAIGFL